MKNVYLVVVAHPDDEILGFGGSGSYFSSIGDDVYPLILSGNVEARRNRPVLDKLQQDIKNANNKVGFKNPIIGNFPNIKFNNVDHIELVKFIEKYIEEIQPTHIFTHHPNDLNNDHHHVSLACQAAARLFQRKDKVQDLKQLALMEISSSTEWTFSVNNTFSPNYFVEISDYVDKKIESLKCYSSVVKNSPHPRSPENIRALARFRGSQCNSKYAEAFQIIYQKK